MAFQLSPGVSTSEVDLTTTVPSVSTTAGAFAGQFTWGPADKLKQITNEISLANTFGKPNSTTAVSFFTASNFLSYGNNLWIARSVGTAAKNATGGTAVLIKNEDVFDASYLRTDSGGIYGGFTARYPGSLGNSLSVQVCDNSTDFAGWAYKGYFPGAPSTSDQSSSAGGSNDEMHIVVIDTNGKFTGTAGTVLEKFGYVSKASNATVNGLSNYYKQVIFDTSAYIYSIDTPDYGNQGSGSGAWGQTIDTDFGLLSGINTTTLTGGVDSAPGNTQLEASYDLFINKDVVDISLILTGDANYTIQNYVISSIAEARKDCVVFISPPSTAVVNTPGSETTNISSWLASLNKTSTYAFADSGWKYQFDKYNSQYRWIPLNGDIAGLCVNTDNVRDPWFSPAGYSRGQVKNAIKLAWNPNQAQRDTIYNTGVNPVVSFPGQGVVLFGDKTLTTKPSAFDRINVRRLFIILEKAIATSAKFSLFEQNDEFTRAQFVSSITPFLRDVQGRRGITDFKVICDTTNNTPGVIDRNEFVGDIYIKPSRSINFIQLNFVAVGTGVEFNTIVGAV